MSLVPAGGILVAAGLDPDRDTARGWAVEELSRPEYQQARPSLVGRALSWLLARIMAALDQIPASGSVLWSTLFALLVVAAVVGLVWLVTGPVRRTASRRGPASDVFGGTRLTAGEHRRAAANAAAAGQWRVAIQEMFRATARSLEERTILDARPGRTADEVAREAGVELPVAAAALIAAARDFDDVTYGARPGDRDGYERAALADREVAGARLRVMTRA